MFRRATQMSLANRLDGRLPARLALRVLNNKRVTRLAAATGLAAAATTVDQETAARLCRTEATALEKRPPGRTGR